MALDILKAVTLSHNASTIMAIRVAFNAGATVEEITEHTGLSVEDVRDALPPAPTQDQLPF
jgi:hypothetical protein